MRFLFPVLKKRVNRKLIQNLEPDEVPCAGRSWEAATGGVETSPNSLCGVDSTWPEEQAAASIEVCQGGRASEGKP